MANNHSPNLSLIGLEAIAKLACPEKWSFAIASLVCLFFLSCSAKSPWVSQSIKTGNPDYNSTRLVYHSPDKLHGIDLELLKTGETTRLYLIVHSHTVPPYKGDPKRAAVLLTIDKKSYTVIAGRREGGQKLLMPDSARELILSALKNGTFIDISLKGYTAKVTSENFSSKYQEWEHPSPFSNPIILPF